MLRKSVILSLFACCLLGCATSQFPLRRDNYFSQVPQVKKTVFLMPFSVDAYTVITKFNTAQLLKEKAELSRELFYRGLKETLSQKGYEITGYFSQEEVEQDNFDEGLLSIMDDLFSELSLAEHSFFKNLKEDRNKPFDYSVGLYPGELAATLPQKPDLLLFIAPAGFIYNLNAFEAGNAALNAVVSLGLSLINPAPDDRVSLRVALVETKEGKIVWYDYRFFIGRTLIYYPHIKDVLMNTFSKLPDACLGEK